MNSKFGLNVALANRSSAPQDQKAPARSCSEPMEQRGALVIMIVWVGCACERLYILLSAFSLYRRRDKCRGGQWDWSTHIIPRIDIKRLLQDFLHCFGVVLNYGLVQQQIVLEDCGKMRHDFDQNLNWRQYQKFFRGPCF